MRGRFKRQPHIKLCAIGTRAEVDFSVKRNALGFGLAALDLHAHLRIVSVPTFPQPRILRLRLLVIATNLTA